MGWFLKEPYGDEVAPIHKWLTKRNKPGHLIYSAGALSSEEVPYSAKVKLKAYLDAGRASVIPANSFENLEKEFRNNPKVKSDDHHILALAQHTGARILLTGDKDLREDFKNHELINEPRGKIYSDQRQAHLLKSSACRRT
ncbi:MAG: hypothetical protein OXD44_10265 [Gammaproteobacteria bacterium]|nr:hypothetical protein [Gammaproteobacteria bacterium]